MCRTFKFVRYKSKKIYYLKNNMFQWNTQFPFLYQKIVQQEDEQRDTNKTNKQNIEN